VVATIETPSSSHGMFLPERKNSDELEPDRFVTQMPMIV